jgi:hypothetical protein
MRVRNKNCNRLNPEDRFFFRHVHQKTVNPRQIIPVFTFFWDDKPKSRRKKIGTACAARTAFLLSLCLSKSCEVT